MRHIVLAALACAAALALAACDPKPTPPKALQHYTPKLMV